MELLELQLKQLQARKDKDIVRANLLTTLLGEINTELKRTISKSAVPVVLDIILKFVKNLKESLKIRETDLAKQELAILEEFLPKPLTSTEIQLELHKLSCINDSTAKNYKGIVMKHFNNNFKGRFDAKVLSESLI